MRTFGETVNLQSGGNLTSLQLHFLTAIQSVCRTWTRLLQIYKPPEGLCSYGVLWPGFAAVGVVFIPDLQPECPSALRPAANPISAEERQEIREDKDGNNILSEDCNCTETFYWSHTRGWGIFESSHRFSKCCC
ncbi:hypothetical protein CHARACLAT_006398 [Characodon lateralis]|uniref:Uncharacterized protein n=1 Tax=Characodon lateralis TaxID=208331 RepID=A0ABU7E7H1_9TELE|nr:hypothetical protein [Characodon lateralis]